MHVRGGSLLPTIGAKQRPNRGSMFSRTTTHLWICCKRDIREEAKVHYIKALDDQILRSEVDHLAISMQLLEDQLRLSATRIEAIKNQAAKFEINIQFLDPYAFEGIAFEASAWNKFLDAQVGPSS